MRGRPASSKCYSERRNHDLHPLPEPGAAKNRLRLVLATDRYDEEVKRLSSLGAIPLNETRLPEVRWTRFADPEGNDFDLVTWQPV